LTKPLSWMRRRKFLALIAILVVAAFIATLVFAWPKPTPQGLSTVDVQIIKAPANSVYFIYPDSNKSRTKPSDVGYPSQEEYGAYRTALGVLMGLFANSQVERADTSASIDAKSGMPRSDLNGPLVLIGGPSLHASVYYYEKERKAPLYLEGSDSKSKSYCLYTREGVKIEPSFVEKAKVGGDTDIFLIEVFKDYYSGPETYGNTLSRDVFVIYGYTWKGTLAGVKFFATSVYPNMASYSDEYYVVRWVDASEGASHDRAPDSGDKYEILAGEVGSSLKIQVPQEYLLPLSALAVLVVGVAVAFRKGWVEVAIERAEGEGEAESGGDIGAEKLEFDKEALREYRDVFEGVRGARDLLAKEREKLSKERESLSRASDDLVKKREALEAMKAEMEKTRVEFEKTAQELAELRNRITEDAKLLEDEKMKLRLEKDELMKAKESFASEVSGFESRMAEMSKKLKEKGRRLEERERALSERERAMDRERIDLNELRAQLSKQLEEISKAKACPSCGRRVDAAAVFCDGCGRRLRNV